MKLCEWPLEDVGKVFKMTRVCCGAPRVNISCYFNVHMSLAIKNGWRIVFSGHYCAIACKLFTLKKDQGGHVDGLLATKHLGGNGRLHFT